VNIATSKWDVQYSEWRKKATGDQLRNRFPGAIAQCLYLGVAAQQGNRRGGRGGDERGLWEGSGTHCEKVKRAPKREKVTGVIKKSSRSWALRDGGDLSWVAKGGSCKLDEEGGQSVVSNDVPVGFCGRPAPPGSRLVSVPEKPNSNRKERKESFGRGKKSWSDRVPSAPTPEETRTRPMERELKTLEN